MSRSSKITVYCFGQFRCPVTVYSQFPTPAPYNIAVIFFHLFISYGYILTIIILNSYLDAGYETFLFTLFLNTLM